LPGTEDFSTNIIAAHTNHLFIVTSSDGVYSIGENTFGQAGLDGGKVHTLTYVVGLSNRNICQVSCGYGHTIFLTCDNKILTVGNSQFGQLGDPNVDAGNHTAPVTVVCPHKVNRVCAGFAHNIVVVEKGTRHHLYGFGSNDNHQLDSTDDTIINKLRALDIDQNLFDFVIDVTCGQDSSAILTDRKQIIIAGMISNFREAEWSLLTLAHPILSLSIGEQNATALLETGEIYMITNNDFEKTSYSLSSPSSISLRCSSNRTVLWRSENTIWKHFNNGFTRNNTHCNIVILTYH
jgi:hypothetical protein